MPKGSPAASSLATLSEVPGTELRQLEATFDNFREFVARYSPWLSDSCIFVETLEEVPVGAPVRLEIWLRERPALILALGQVDWVRKVSESDDDDGPPGVAVNITYLDPASARLVDSIFRLYTGQQSAAMGKDVVETWELDVESLIDQAFPGAPPPATPPQGREVQIMAADGTAGDALGWSSPDVEPIDVGADADEPASPTKEVQIMAADGTAGDALGWSSPDVEPIDVGEVMPSLDAGDEIADLAQEVEIELPESLDETELLAPIPASFDAPSPVTPEELNKLEVPEVEVELEVPAVETDESPATAAPAQFEIVDAAPAAGEASLETLDETPLDELEMPDQAGWEESLSSAFSEHETEEPASENTGFGFGLVQEPEPPAEVVPAEEAPVEPAAVAAVPEPAVPRPDAPSLAASPPAAAMGDQPVSTAPIHPVAGAAAATDASDTSFLRRSVLLFLFAVVAVGLLFVWLRSRQPSGTPAGVATVAETPPGAETAGEPPSGTSATATAPGQGQPPSVPGGEPVPSEPAQTEPAQTEPAQTEPAQTEPAQTEPAPVEPAQTAPTPAVVPPPPAPVVTPPPPAVAQDPAAIAAEVEKLVKSWATAWSAQDPDAFVACYASDYSPSGTGRREWIRQRQARIRAPASILVQAKDVSVEVLDAKRATATFYQDYETDTKHLYTWKTMEMALLPEGWRIVKERVGR